MSDTSPVIKFIVVGHVDHGKSTLCGHILYKSGYVDDRQLDELRKKAIINKKRGWEFAYILDVFEEEQTRGKTLDYTPLDFKYNDQNYTLIDTPGHKHLIRTLISGLNYYNSKSLIGCLIISAVENEFISGFEKGQTKEDILLLKASGIENLIILINKMDIIKWNMKIYDKYKSILDNYIKKLGFKKYEFIPISGYEGTGIDTLFNTLNTFNIKYDNNTNIIDKTNHIDIIVQLKVIYNDTFDTIITNGFEGVAHINSNEYDISIINFKHFDIKTSTILNKTKNNNLMINSDIVLAKLRIINTDTDNDMHFNVSLKDRIILRKNDWTIAFGIVYKLL